MIEPNKPQQLWTRAVTTGAGSSNFLQDARTSDLRDLRGRSVLIAVEDQLTAGLALLELDGVARRLVLLPPGIPAASTKTIANDAGAGIILSIASWRGGASK